MGYNLHVSLGYAFNVVTCPTEVKRPRFLAANLFLYLCLNLVYDDKGNGGKSEEGGNSGSAVVNGYWREIFS